MKSHSLVKLILALALVCALGFVSVRLVTLALGFVRENNSRQAVGEADPMFAEEAEVMTATQPPEEAGAVSRDHSAEWVVTEQTPVDKTAEELIREQGDAGQP